MVTLKFKTLPSKAQLSGFGLTYDNVAECFPAGFTVTAGVDCEIETHIGYSKWQREKETVCVEFLCGLAMPLSWFDIECPGVSADDAALWLAYDEVADRPTWDNIVEHYCHNNEYSGLAGLVACKKAYHKWEDVSHTLYGFSIDPTEYKAVLMQVMDQDNKS